MPGGTYWTRSIGSPACAGRCRRQACPDGAGTFRLCISLCHSAPVMSWRVQGVVAPVPVEDSSVVTIRSGRPPPGGARGGAGLLGLALASCRRGGAGAPGSGPAVRPPPKSVRSSLEAGGAAPYHARHPSGSERRPAAASFCPLPFLLL